MKKFITTALPYANGDLHWGHFFEAIIADIYVRHQKGVLISGDDQHGAAITLFVEKNNVSIHEHLDGQYDRHQTQYRALHINHDFYGQTRSPLHKELVIYAYRILLEKGLIQHKPTISWFDTQAHQFLPDRYVKGQCPHCHASDVYPHICEFCNGYFDSEALINPISVVSGTTPILQETIHSFLQTDSFYDYLPELCDHVHIHDSIRKKVLDPTLTTLESIDITRDLPYFGIGVPELPLAFYVWFDAPIAYLSFILESIEPYETGISIEQRIQSLKDIHIEHIIGKDIVYFHTFYWLNLLRLLELPLPSKIHVHGWIVNSDGGKYSKSKGDSLDIQAYTSHEIDAIRLYLGSIYDGTVNDHDFNIPKALEHYNQFIIGKYINIYSRISKLAEKHDIAYIQKGPSYYDYEQNINKALGNCDLKKAIKYIWEWVDTINNVIQERQPWKTSGKELHNIIALTLNEFRLLAPYIGLFCPTLYTQLETIDYQEIRHLHLAYRL